MKNILLSFLILFGVIVYFKNGESKKFPWAHKYTRGTVPLFSFEERSLFIYDKFSIWTGYNRFINISYSSVLYVEFYESE